MGGAPQLVDADGERQCERRDAVGQQRGRTDDGGRGGDVCGQVEDAAVRGWEEGACERRRGGGQRGSPTLRWRHAERLLSQTPPTHVLLHGLCFNRKALVEKPAATVASTGAGKGSAIAAGAGVKKRGNSERTFLFFLTFRRHTRTLSRSRSRTQLSLSLSSGTHTHTPIHRGGKIRVEPKKKRLHTHHFSFLTP